MFIGRPANALDSCLYPSLQPPLPLMSLKVRLASWSHCIFSPELFTSRDVVTESGRHCHQPLSQARKLTRRCVTSPRSHGWCQRQDYTQDTWVGFGISARPFLPARPFRCRCQSICPSKSSLSRAPHIASPDCDPLITSPPADVLNSEAAGFLKNTWVWGVRESPGITGRLVHSLFVGRGSSVFLHPKGAHPPNRAGTIVFFNGPCLPTSTTLSCGIAYNLFTGRPCCGVSEPWIPRGRRQFQEVASGCLPTLREACLGHLTSVGSGPFSPHWPQLTLPAKADQAHSGRGSQDPGSIVVSTQAVQLLGASGASSLKWGDDGPCLIGS